MSKKTITLVLIILLVINTSYWLYVTIRVSKYDRWVESINRREMILRMQYEELKVKITRVKGGEENTKKIMPAGKKEEGDKIQEELVKLGEEVKRNTEGFTDEMIVSFAESNSHTTPLLILGITDVVLIAIYFMIIPSYKKD